MSKIEIAKNWLRDGHNVANLVMGLVLSGFLIAFSTGAMAQSGNVYGDRGAQVLSSATRAIVLQTRVVSVEPQDPTRYAGAAAGAAIGGGLGALAGKKSNGAQAVLGLVGATLGGLAGSKLANNWGANSAVEYIVQTVNADGREGQIVSITQPNPAEVIGAGEPVYLINTVGTMRVVRMQMLQPPHTIAPMMEAPRAHPSVHQVDYQLSGRF